MRRAKRSHILPFHNDGSDPAPSATLRRMWIRGTGRKNPFSVAFGTTFAAILLVVPRLLGFELLSAGA